MAPTEKKATSAPRAKAQTAPRRAKAKAAPIPYIQLVARRVSNFCGTLTNKELDDRNRRGSGISHKKHKTCWCGFILWVRDQLRSVGHADIPGIAHLKTVPVPANRPRLDP